MPAGVERALKEGMSYTARRPSDVRQVLDFGSEISAFLPLSGGVFGRRCFLLIV